MRNENLVTIRKRSQVLDFTGFTPRFRIVTYDPAWEPYFEERLGVKMAGTLAGRWTLRLLWKEQGGICPVCNQKITTVTGWHNHHIVWRTHGGKDTIENRVLVHPNCHQQIHSQELDVGKPRPAKGVREA